MSEFNMDTFTGMWSQAQQELAGMWEGLDVIRSSALASDAVKRAAGTPENATMAESIERARGGGTPVVLDPVVPEQIQELDLLGDTIGTDSTAALGTEMDFELFKSQLLEDEGSKTTVYKDTEQHLTVGVGHKVLDSDNLKLGSVIDKDTLDRMLSDDAAAAINNTKALVNNWEGLPSNVKHVLSNMTFQLGKKGMSKFDQTIALVDAGDFKAASVEMLDSDWAKQTPNRANKMADLMASSPSS